MLITDLRSLLLHQLKDTMHVKLRLTQALPMLIDASVSPSLREVLARQCDLAGEHMGRLSVLLRDLDQNSLPDHCQAIEAMLEEVEQLLRHADGVDPAVLDAAIIAAVQRMQHYSIAAFGCARAFVRTLGDESAAAALDEMLLEDRDADARLTEIADTEVNPRALERSS